MGGHFFMVWNIKASLTAPLFIEVPVPRQESERLSIYALIVVTISAFL
jgi:hypothetical protein